MNYLKLLFLLLVLSEFVNLQAKTVSVSNHQHYIQVQIKFPTKVAETDRSKISGGQLITLQSELVVFPESFKKYQTKLSGIKGIVVQKRSETQLQIIVQHDNNTNLKIYRNSFIDSLYHVDYYIFKTTWYKQSWLANLLAGIQKQNNGLQEKAIINFKRSIQLKPENPNSYFRAAQYRLYKNEPGNALINLKKAVRMGCDSLRLNYLFAIVYQKMGKQNLANSYRQKYDTQYRQFAASRKSEVSDPDSMKQPVMAENNDEERVSQPATTQSQNYIFIGFIALTVIIVLVLVLSQKRSNKFYEDVAESEDIQTDSEDEYVGNKDGLTENSVSQNRESEPYDESGIPDMEESEKLTEGPDTEENMITPETVSKAKELNLGVGELELAINLQSRLKNKKRLAGKEEIIIELYNRGMDIHDISKELNLNYGEVDLVIGLNKHRLNKRLS